MFFNGEVFFGYEHTIENSLRFFPLLPDPFTALIHVTDYTAKTMELKSDLI